MADKEILAVTIDDSEFSEFKRKFDEYEAAVKAMPKHWQDASSEITAQKTQFEKMLKGVDEQSRSVASAAKSQGQFNNLLDAAGVTWLNIHKSGKFFAGNIVHATQSLMHWTKLTAVFSGILGAGGLFGINRMAASVAAQRTSAAGLGVSYGEQASFLTNFQRLGNVEGILQGFSQAETDVSKKYALRQWLGHAESGDPAKDFSEGLGRFKEFVDKTPHDLLGNMLQAKGYNKLGIGVEQANIVHGMSRAEIDQISGRYRGDLATRLGLPPDVAKKWTEFTEQINRAGGEIATVFEKKAVKLTKPLENLSESFIHLTEDLLKDGGPISGWIKDLGRGIRTFADDLGSGTVQAKAADIGKNIEDTVKLFNAIVAKAPGGLAVLLGMGFAARVGGVAGAIGEGLAGAGAVGAGAVAGAAGATAWGMNKLMPQHPERLRRGQEYENAGGSPTSPHPTMTEHHRQATRHHFGHPHINRESIKPGGAASGAAEPGTPWNREFQPHKGRRGIVSSHEFYNGLIARGATPAAAAALTGNAAFESGSGSWDKIVLDPATDAGHKDWGTGDAAVGAFQWEGRRKLGVSPTVESETGHAIDELNSGEQGLTLEQLNRIKDPRRAAAIVNRRYERPLHPNASMATRQRYAAKISFFEKSRHSFGHPHIGRHPATMGLAHHSMIIEDDTGGMVHIADLTQKETVNPRLFTPHHSVVPNEPVKRPSHIAIPIADRLA